MNFKNLNKSIIFFVRLVGAKLVHRSIPFSVVFSLTNNCNSGCKYCYAKYYNRLQEELPTEKIFAIIDKLAKFGTKRVILSGGEPLLRQDIEQIVDYVKFKKMECAIATNGRIAVSKIDTIKKVDLIYLSFDGNKVAHDTNRGRGSWSKAIHAIKIIRRHGIPLRTNTVLTKHNLKDINYILKLAKIFDFCASFAILANVENSHGTAPTDVEYKEVLRKLIIHKKNREPVFNSVKALELALNWPQPYRADKITVYSPGFEYPKCYAGKFHCIIDVNGDIYPCAMLVDKFKPLNVFRHGLKKALERASNHNCLACHLLCMTEINYLFALDFGTIFNYLKNS